MFKMLWKYANMVFYNLDPCHDVTGPSFMTWFNFFLLCIFLMKPYLIRKKKKKLVFVPFCVSCLGFLSLVVQMLILEALWFIWPGYCKYVLRTNKPLAEKYLQIPDAQKCWQFEIISCSVPADYKCSVQPVTDPCGGPAAVWLHMLNAVVV